MRRSIDRLVLLLVGVALATPTMLSAQGEHARRAAAELQVLIDDARLLQQPQLTEQRTRGLQQRIEGMLAALSVLLRFADQELGRSSVARDITGLRQLLAQRDYPALVERLRAIGRDHPLHTAHLLHLSPSAARLRQALGLHRRFCAACHDSPLFDSERPAFDLYREAKRMPPETFVARMLVGIRGDVVTGLGNPFTDEELGALIALYRRAEESATAESLQQ
ncbi:MAG: hypothetical protein KDI68_07565 [Gammaproteobacteria bacterium]|nr:hypothetical protein [Gammaproteobacteria bacterium]